MDLGKRTGDRSGYDAAAKALQKTYGSGGFAWVKQQQQAEKERKDREEDQIKQAEEAARYKQSTEDAKGIFQKAGDAGVGVLKGIGDSIHKGYNALSTGFDREEAARRNEELDQQIAQDMENGPEWEKNLRGVGGFVADIPRNIVQNTIEAGRDIWEMGVAGLTSVASDLQTNHGKAGKQLRDLMDQANDNPALWGDEAFLAKMREANNNRVGELNEAKIVNNLVDIQDKDALKTAAGAAEAAVDIATFGTSAGLRKAGEAGVKGVGLGATKLGKGLTKELATGTMKKGGETVAKNAFGRALDAGVGNLVEGSVSGALGAVQQSGEDVTTEELFKGAGTGALAGFAFPFLTESWGNAKVKRMEKKTDKVMNKIADLDDEAAFNTIKKDLKLDNYDAEVLLQLAREDAFNKEAADVAGDAVSDATAKSDISAKSADDISEEEAAKILQEAKDKTRATELATESNDISRQEYNLLNGDDEFLAQNGYLDRESAGKLAYDDVLRENPEVASQVQELSLQVADADQAIEAINNQKMQSAYSVEKDNLDQRFQQIFESTDPQTERGVQQLQMLERDYDRVLGELQTRYAEEFPMVEELDRALEGATRQKFELGNQLREVQESMQGRIDELSQNYNLPDYNRIDARVEELRARRASIVEEQKAIEKRQTTTPATVADADTRIKQAELGDAPELQNTDGSINNQKTGEYLHRVREQKASLEATQSKKKLLKGETVQEAELDNIIIQEAKQSSFKNGQSVTQLIETPTNVLERAGLDELSFRVKEGSRQLGHAIHQDARFFVDNGFDKMSKNAKRNVALFLDGQLDASKLSKAQMDKANLLKGWLKEKADLMDLPDDLRISQYLPHIFQRGKDGKFIISAEMPNSLKKHFNDDTWAGNIDNARITGAEGYTMDLGEIFQAYSSQVNRRVYLEPVLKDISATRGNVTDNKLANYLLNLGNTIKGERAAVDVSLDNLTNGAFTKGLDIFRQANYMANLGGNPRSVISNLTQGVNTVAEVGYINGTVGYKNAVSFMRDIASGDKSRLDIYHKYGILDGRTVGEGANAQIVKKLSNKVSGITMAPFNAAETLNRMAAFEGGVNKFMNKYSQKYWDNPDLIDTAKISNKMKSGLKKMIRQSDNYEDAMFKYGADVSSRTQFSFGAASTQPIMRSKTGKTLLQYQGSTIKTMEYTAQILGGSAGDIKKLIASGDFTFRDAENLAKLGRYVGSAGMMTAVMGGVIGQDFSQYFPNPVEIFTNGSPLTQLLLGNEYGKTGINALVGDQEVTDKDGNVLEGFDRYMQISKDIASGNLLPSVVPLYNQIKRMGDAAKSADRGFSLTASDRIKFPVDQNEEMQAALFGLSSTPNGREYYNNDMRSLSKRDSEKILSAPKELQREYYDFYRAAESLTGRQEHAKKVSAAKNEGNLNKARRYAEEYNQQVREKLAPYYAKYPVMARQLEDEMNKRMYINFKYLEE